MYLIDIIHYHYMYLTDMIHSKGYISHKYFKEVYLKIFSEYIFRILKIAKDIKFH
jgi:hypothetical protein